MWNGWALSGYVLVSHDERLVRISGIAGLWKQHGQRCHCCETVPEVFLWHCSRTNLV